MIDVTTTASDGSQASIFDKNGNCNSSMQTDPQGLVNQYCGLYHVFRDTLFVENNYQVHIRTR